MNNTPLSFRTHISIFGKTNAGKSSLFNELIGQDMAIVSAEKGTTTDPVTKAMELIPYGPVALTDTAGLCDDTLIGSMRIEKTEKILEKTDFALYTASVDDFDVSLYNEMQKQFGKKHIPHLLVFTKSDLGTGNLKEKYPEAVFVSIKDNSIETLKNILIEKLSLLKTKEETMIGNLLPKGSTVIMVVPIDSEAPKGRLILPQVQFLRDCLDHGIKTMVVRDTELRETLEEQKKIDLVVTDSLIFGKVSEFVPENIMLTSFSILMASMKGDINTLISGAQAIRNLHDGSKILMVEACTHNTSHEDIGRVKIPKLLQKYTGKQLEFEYFVHQDFPNDLSQYDLVIHCGGCMINSRSMQNRIEFCLKNNVPITNYGITLACVNGILDRSTEIFKH